MGKPKVVIFCGGLGTRLKEETEFRPKPMIPIGEKPILWHIMKIYSHFGYNEFILCLGYKGDAIKDYFYRYEILNRDFTLELGKHSELQFHGNHSEIDWKITFVDTGLETRKGARLKKIERFIESEWFLATYGDGVANIDINKLVEFHTHHKKIASITGVHPPSRFGELIAEGDCVKKFSEKPQTASGSINGGFFVFNKEIFDYLEDKDDCDLEFGLFELLAEKNEIMMYEHNEFWYCMDNIRDMEHLNMLWASGNIPWKIYDD